MKILRNEKGFALLFVLILATIALLMTISMLLMVGKGSYVSGQQKRYRTAVEAARGGMESMLQLIANKGVPLYGGVLIDNTSTSGQLPTKLAFPTTTWGAGVDNTITINPAVSTTYDMRIDLGAYRVYSKVVDTVDGNSGPDEGLVKSGVVSAGSGEVVVVSIPYLYTVEVLSQSQTNTTERSKFSVLYQY